MREADTRQGGSLQVQVLRGRLEVITHTHSKAEQVRCAVAGWKVTDLVLSLDLFLHTNTLHRPPAQQQQQDRDKDGHLDDDQLPGVDGRGCLLGVLVVSLIGEDCV